jgi:hypothetical protein
MNILIFINFNLIFNKIIFLITNIILKSPENEISIQRKKYMFSYW